MGWSILERKIELKPSPKQVLFLQDHHRHVCYGGARGGGKSWVIRVKALALAMQHAGIKILILRATFRELDNNHIQPMTQLLTGIAKYNRQDKRFTFPNGSTISFGYCQNDSDLGQYQGAEYDVIFLDEATNLKEEWIKQLNVCVRGANDHPKRTYYTCNPGGVSHGYIKRLFVDRKFEENEVPDEYTFIQARVTDNAALMAMQPKYIQELEALPPKLRKAWLEGSWDVYEGQFFEDFRDNPEHYEDRQWTHVIAPFKIPAIWEVYRSFDWGYRRPFSCGWWAVDTDGVIYRIAELYGCQKSGGKSIPNEGLKWTPEKVFSEIQRMEQEHPLLKGKEIRGVADPAIWDAESGISLAETATHYGIYFNRGDHKRIPGWMQCHYRMQFDKDGYPRFYVFNTCVDFIRTIPLLQYDEHRAEDLDSDGEDHAADEWRYFCMSRPIKPVVPEEEYVPAFGSDPLNQWG